MWYSRLHIWQLLRDLYDPLSEDEPLEFGIQHCFMYGCLPLRLKARRDFRVGGWMGGGRVGGRVGGRGPPKTPKPQNTFEYSINNI
jgi:hypothetical protein